MEQRRLGRIGHMSSVLIYGGAALGDVTQEVADASIRQALDAGINHFDTAAAYGDSELRIGEWMPRIRDGSSSPARRATGPPARVRLDPAIAREAAGRALDLLQLHAVCDLDGPRCWLTGTGGALEGALRARRTRA